MQQDEEDFFTDEGLKIFRAEMAKAENFFKHANRDPDGVIEFNAEDTIFMLVDCFDA